MTAASALELDAAQALFAARALVASIHDPGPWEMRWGPVTVPAEKVVDERGVVFTATFPDFCWLTQPDDGLALLLRGETIGIKSVRHPGDTAFVVTWELAALETV